MTVESPELVPWTAMRALRGILPAELRQPTDELRGASVTCAVRDLWNPVGVATGVVDRETGVGRLVWFFVRPRYRRRGLARRMIRFLEERLIERGCRRLMLDYGRAEPSPFDHWLEADDWTAERTFHVAVGDASGLRSKCLRQRSLPPWLSVFLWRELAVADRRAILRRRDEEDWYPAELDPFANEERIDSGMSFGLRFADDVVGWVIHQRIAPDRVRVARLFVSREPLVRGHGLALLGRSLQRLVAAEPGVRVEFRVSPDNRPMLGFLRRLSPMLLDRYDLICATRSF